MIYGYARVSTKGQARNGNSLEQQVETLTEAGAEKIYHDSFTGTKINRPEFDKLLKELKPDDILMVTKLDRFARSASQGIELIEDLISKGVIVHILNLGVMDDTPTGKLIRTIMLGFAEFERDMIVERTSEGKAIAREKGIRVDGRPEIEVPDDTFYEYYRRQQEKKITVKDICVALHISRSKWYSLVNQHFPKDVGAENSEKIEKDV